MRLAVSVKIQSLAGSYQLGPSVGQVSEGPEAVLDQALAGVSEVDGQGLHAAGVDDGRLVARAHRQN